MPRRSGAKPGHPHFRVALVVFRTTPGQAILNVQSFGAKNKECPGRIRLEQDCSRRVCKNMGKAAYEGVLLRLYPRE
jgi:hypothetical protein